jgi:DNA-binding NarL/FixJ family response regulator
MVSGGVFSRQFIGRGRELAFLMDRADPAVRPGGCVVIRGEAGLGKTRLVTEFGAAAGARGTRVVVGSTRVYANRPYAAFLEALGGLGIDLPPAAEDAGGDGRAAWFERVASLLRASAASPATAIVLEDLHWADAATLDLLRYCASRLRDAPVLFVATYRVDEVDDDTAHARAFSALEREADVIVLQPLAPGQVEHLIQSALGDIGVSLPAAVVADVRDLAEGRPLFAEELLRGVLERLGRDENARPSVPTSIRAAVRERFLVLPKSDRELLLHASLFGRRFSARRLQLLTASGEAETLAALRSARDLQLIVEDPDDAEGDVFAFRHALTREAIYAEMLRAEARIRHARVAQLLIEESGPDVAAIAEHAWRAGLGEAAAEWNERAGDEAAAIFAFAEAARAYERAFKSSTDAGRLARVSERAAEAVYRTGDVDVAAHWFGEAARTLLAAGDAPRSISAALQRARVLAESGRFEDGIREAEVLLSAPYAAPRRFQIDAMISGLLLWAGRPAEALTRIRAAEADGARSDPSAWIRMCAADAYAQTLLGNVDDARARYVETLALVEAAGSPEIAPRTYNNWGMMELTYGTAARARTVYADGMAAATAMQHVTHIARLLHNAAIAAIVAGDLDEAERDVTHIDALKHGIPSLHPWRSAAKLRLGLLRGYDLDELLSESSETLTSALASGDLQGAAVLSGALAFALAEPDRSAAAARIVASASSALEADFAPFWLLDAALRWGGVDDRAHAHARLTGFAAHETAHAARGLLRAHAAREASRRRRREEASTLALEAAAAFAACGWRLEEAFAREAAGRLADALAIYREIGAHADVRRATAGAAASRRRGDATLTSREREVAELVVHQQSARAIAHALTISERTVETHVASIYRKLGVGSRQELASMLQPAVER